MNFALKYLSRLGKNSKVHKWLSKVLEVVRVTWLESVVDSFHPQSLSLLPHVAKFLTFSSHLTDVTLPPWSLPRFLHSMKSLPFSDHLCSSSSTSSAGTTLLREPTAPGITSWQYPV